MSPVDVQDPAPPARRRRGVLLASGVIAAVALTAIVFYQLGSPGTPEARPSPTPRPTTVEQLTTSEIYAALAPSVVTIENLRGGTGDVQGTGTGVIANTDGVILTALHVVAGAGAVRVTYADGTESDAEVLASDPASDIALLATTTPPTVLVPAVLGNSGRLAIGDDVVAIGNQLGLRSSATAGVISGLNRAAAGTNGTRLSGLIQFDAAVNPGSSGGPLVNGRGETVGIVVALANPTDDDTFIGIGFAVPIGTALGAGGDGNGPQQ